MMPFGTGKVVDGDPVPFATLGAVHVAEFGAGEVQLAHRDPELRGVWEGIPVRIPVSITGRMI